MGLRFRRSVRLFPGVRLNFSRSGVSTSIGVRGASVTLGQRGVYGNVGLPGSGVSYRTRLDAPNRTRPSAPEPGAPAFTSPQPSPIGPMATPGTASLAGTEVEIKSADVAALTSPGLGDLKQLINEASSRQTELSRELMTRKAALKKAADRLELAQSFVIRLFTENSIPRLVDAANAAEDRRDETQANLDGCYVEVDFTFDAATQASYAALVVAFDALRTSQ